MPTFEFTSPEGKKYTVAGPDGATKEQAFQMLQTQIGAAKTAEKPPESSLLSDIAQGAGNIVAGAVRGAGSIGSTILAPYDMAKDALAGKGLSLESNRQRRADIDAGLQTMGAQPDALLYKGGKLGAEIAGTAGVGGLLAKGVTAVAPSIAASPLGANLLASIASSGLRTGAPVANTLAGRAADLGIRAAGGAITGGASAGLVSPEDAGTGAVIGAALPPALAGAARTTEYAGRAVGSIVKPFTAAGQDEIAGKVIRKFAEGGPTAVNAAQVVPGSAPTLAEATGNAGLATLQRGVRDLRPNAFAEREQLNAAARNSAFDQVAGDAAQLEFYKASRSQAADELYKKALEADPSGNLTAYLKGQITQLLKRPSVNDASKTAQRWAIERGEKPSADGSLTALHDVKMAIDDKIAEAVRQGAGGEVKALQATKDKLLNVMEKLSPDYAEARTTYAEMSKPINAMETLQGMKLRDSQGNITLARVQNAMRSLEAQMNAPGANPAKSVTQEQMAALTAIRDDLLRQSNLGLGRSIGSNTFQNLATDNILNSIAGNTLTRLADKLGVSGAVGQLGRLAYSGPNEAIRNRLADMMLSPQLAAPALSGATQLAAPNALARLMGSSAVQQPIYRSAPVLSSSQ